MRLMNRLSKIQELIVYIASRGSGDPRLGRTKLAKLMFLADFEAYAVRGVSISGATYRKRPYGPMPDEELLANRELVANSHIEIRDETYFGYRQKKVVAKREPDLSAFSPDELEIVDRVIDRHWEDSATFLSDLSHEHPGWKLCAYDEVIPYGSVFWPTEPPSDRDIARAMKLVAETEGRL